MIPKDARLIIEAHNIATLFDDEEAVTLLKEHNPALLTAYEKLLNFAESNSVVVSMDEALDLLYDSLDNMMRLGHFEEIDVELEAIVANDCSTDVLLGILTATLPGANRLKRRAALFDDVRTVLIDRGEYEGIRLLVGLEG